jgi:hypothetical protein
VLIAGKEDNIEELKLSVMEDLEEVRPPLCSW